MRTEICISVVVLLGLGTGSAGWAQGKKLDTARIQQLTGVKGQLIEKEGVFRVVLPRPELKTTVADIPLPAAMGFSCWASFMRAGDATMVMGDMVLTEDEVNPVMSAVLDRGLEVTALHNHFLWDNPRVMFMHIGGMGDQDQLALGVGDVFRFIKSASSERRPTPRPRVNVTQTTLNPGIIDDILGVHGEMANGLYRITIGQSAKMHDVQVDGAMGVATWIAFAGSDAEAVVDGDFVVPDTQLQQVLKALRAGGINITAIHNHMIEERPRMMFLHFWGAGSTTDLAQGFRLALDLQGGGAVPVIVPTNAPAAGLSETPNLPPGSTP